MTMGIVYYAYSLGIKNADLINKCQRQLKKSAGDMKIVSVTNIPTEFGTTNIVIERGKYQGFMDMFQRILAGLKAIDTDYVFLCEDDDLYPKEHFDFVPPKDDVYYYDMNCWQVRASDGFAVRYDAKRLSGLCANREFLIKHYEKRIGMVEEIGFSRRMGFEPGTHRRKERVDDYPAEGWMSPVPYVDIVMENATERRWRQQDFRSQKNCQNWKESWEIPEWGKFKDFYERI